MILERVKQSEYARELGLIAHDGSILSRGVADVLRAPLERWGLSPRTAVLHQARKQLDAAGLLGKTSQPLETILAHMIQLGECAEVKIGYDRYIAPVPPRWIRTGQGSGTLLSIFSVPEEILASVSTNGGHDIVRRIRVQCDKDLAALRIAGVQETSLRKWLRPFGYLTHARRRQQTLIRSDLFSLSEFWKMLVSQVESVGQPLSNEAKIRAVVDRPGGYFGRHHSPKCEGRWTEDIPNGVWCAYRQGYGPRHWHPIILLVEGILRRAIDLYNQDEWLWAFVARAVCNGIQEQVERVDNQVKLTSPIPAQLSAAMDILGPQRNPWIWEVHPATPLPWSEFR